jgi:hypothetical protein
MAFIKVIVLYWVAVPLILHGVGVGRDARGSRGGGGNYNGGGPR